MSDAFDVKYNATNVGTLGTAIMPLFKNMNSNGAITILEANLVSCATGTTIGDLIFYSGTDTTGTGTKGTICTFGSPGATAYAVGSATLLTATVPANNWVAYNNRLGTTNATHIVSVAFVNGRAYGA
jgi:hypothetical protein